MYLAVWVIICTFMESKLILTEVKSSCISLLTTSLASPEEWPEESPCQTMEYGYLRWEARSCQYILEGQTEADKLVLYLLSWQLSGQGQVLRPGISGTMRSVTYLF